MQPRRPKSAHIGAFIAAAAPLVAAALGIACTSATDAAGPGGVPEPPAAHITIGFGGTDYGPTHLVIAGGSTVPLTAVVRDSSGALLPSAPAVKLRSRAPSIVALDTAGVITGVGLGVTYVVGTARVSGRDLADSVSVTVGCLAFAAPGLRVAVVDSATGQSVLAGATVRVQSPTFRDSVTVPEASVGMLGWATAWEKRGTFEVTVERDGYAPWRHTDIVVTGDLCHVRTVDVVARLQAR